MQKTSNSASAETELEALRTENKQLRERLEQHDKLLTLSSRTFGWAIDRWWGSDVRSTSGALGRALEAWRQDAAQMPIRETADLIGSVLYRLTRIGLFRLGVAVLIAVATLWLSLAQVLLLRQQNRLLDAQTHAMAMTTYFELTRQFESLQDIISQVASKRRVLDQLSENLTSTSAKQLKLDRFLAIGPSDETIARVYERCGMVRSVENDPVDRATRAAGAAKEGDLTGARSMVAELIEWWTVAQEACQSKRDQIRTTLNRVLSSTQSEPMPIVR